MTTFVLQQHFPPQATDSSDWVRHRADEATWRPASFDTSGHQIMLVRTPSPSFTCLRSAVCHIIAPRSPPSSPHHCAPPNTTTFDIVVRAAGFNCPLTTDNGTPPSCAVPYIDHACAGTNKAGHAQQQRDRCEIVVQCAHLTGRRTPSRTVTDRPVRPRARRATTTTLFLCTLSRGARPARRQLHQVCVAVCVRRCGAREPVGVRNAGTSVATPPLRVRVLLIVTTATTRHSTAAGRHSDPAILGAGEDGTRLTADRVRRDRERARTVPAAAADRF